MEDLKKSYEKISIFSHSKSWCDNKRQPHSYKIIYEDHNKINIKCIKCGCENAIKRN